MIRRPPRSTQSRSSAASDVYKRQIWHRGISTTISRAKAHLAQQAMISKAKIQLAPPYISKEQQSESTSGRHSRVDESGISTAISKAKAFQDDTAVSTRAVYQPRSARRKHIWRSGIPTAISNANPLRHSSKTQIQLAPYVNHEPYINGNQGLAMEYDQSYATTYNTSGDTTQQPRVWFDIIHEMPSISYTKCPQ